MTVTDMFNRANELKEVRIKGYKLFLPSRTDVAHALNALMRARGSNLQSADRAGTFLIDAA